MISTERCAVSNLHLFVSILETLIGWLPKIGASSITHAGPLLPRPSTRFRNPDGAVWILKLAGKPQTRLNMHSCYHHCCTESGQLYPVESTIDNHDVRSCGLRGLCNESNQSWRFEAAFLSVWHTHQSGKVCVSDSSFLTMCVAVTLHCVQGSVKVIHPQLWKCSCMWYDVCTGVLQSGVAALTHSCQVSFV